MDDYYRTCTIISYKTSNNQKIIDDMEFYVFNNFMIYLKDVIEDENKPSTGNNESAEQMKEDASKQLSSSMNKSKAMLPSSFRGNSGIKMPKV